MNQSPKAPQSAPSDAPNESKTPKIVRAVGLGVLVLVLWLGDKIAVGQFPASATWRYVVGAIIISVGLIAVISVGQRFAEKNG